MSGCVIIDSLFAGKCEDGGRLMGCDIHSYAEVFRDGKWCKVGKIFKNPYYDQTSKSGFNGPLTDHPYDLRTYDLYAMLADVRNGYGFAGVDTGSGFKTISNPRGLPNDVSDDVRQESEDWGLDGHSHSWLLLSEIIDWSGWKLETTKRGCVSPIQYQDFKEKGKPESYCGWAAGPTTKHVSNEEMDEIISCKLDDDISYYTQVSWKETYKDRAGTFLTETIPALKKLSQKTEDIRMVFWFDN
jgi:hypothetical protein